jgi:hypothetical protein
MGVNTAKTGLNRNSDDDNSVIPAPGTATARLLGGVGSCFSRELV